MSFHVVEKHFIREFLGEPITEAEIENYLPSETYNYLKRIGRLHTCCDKLIFREKNKFRPWDTCTITKLITEKFDINQFLTDLVFCIEDNYLIWIDFHFLLLIPDDEEGATLRFQSGSKASSINKQVKITLCAHEENLLREFKQISNVNLLNEVFYSHSELFGFKASGLRPHSLVSILVHIQKFD